MKCFLQLNFFLNQFCPPDRLDRNGYKGEILVYVGPNVTLVLSLKSFCLHFIIKSKIKNPQCFKNSANHLALIFFSQIVLIHSCAQPLLKVLALSHCWKFLRSATVESCISDFHKIRVIKLFQIPHLIWCYQK